MSKFHVSLLLAFLGSLSVFAQAPSNDNCADAIAIGQVTDQPFSTLNANTDGPAHGGLCASSGSTPDSCYNDIWYKFTADFTGTALYTLCGTANLDSKIIVYKADAVCPLTPDDVLACNEDGSGCANFTSQVSFDVVSGKTYLLRLGGYGDGSPGESGTGTFSVNQYFSNAPANDKCASAIVLTLDANDSTKVDFTTVDATTDGPQHILQSCFDPGEEFVFNNIWYKYTATFTGYMEWSNCGTATYDSRMAVYDDVNCPPAASTLVGCSDDGITANNTNCEDYTSRAIFQVQAGRTYLFSLGGWSSGDAGEGYFTLKRTADPVIPANDNCVNAISAPIVTTEQADAFEGAVNGTTINASFQDIYPRPECRPTGEHWDVWYKFNSGTNTELELRFYVGTNNAQYIIDLFRACGEPDTTDSDFCVRTDELPVGTSYFLTLDSLPGVPTEYILRVGTRVTGDFPGDFYFQLVGTPYVNTDDLQLRRFAFSPNPVNTNANLRFELPNVSSGVLSISNAVGMGVYAQSLPTLAAGLHNIELPLQDLPAGLYFLNLQLKEGRKTVRFVKE